MRLLCARLRRGLVAMLARQTNARSGEAFRGGCWAGFGFEGRRNDKRRRKAQCRTLSAILKKKEIAQAQRRGHTRHAKRLHRTAARRRRDAIHKFTRRIVLRYQRIVVGDVNSRKSWLRHGWPRPCSTPGGACSRGSYGGRAKRPLDALSLSTKNTQLEPAAAVDPLRDLRVRTCSM
jgi:hypothetical protein